MLSLVCCGMDHVCCGMDRVCCGMDHVCCCVLGAVADVGLLSVVAQDVERERGKSDTSSDSPDPVSRIVVSTRCYGVLFDDVTYEVQWSPMSRMRWGPWLRTVASCKLPGRSSRRILNNITGYIRPGELYVAYEGLP